MNELVASYQFQIPPVLSCKMVPLHAVLITQGLARALLVGQQAAYDPEVVNVSVGSQLIVPPANMLSYATYVIIM
jgi:hypothetical protein